MHVDVRGVYIIPDQSCLQDWSTRECCPNIGDSGIPLLALYQFILFMQTSIQDTVEWR
jgi:hypothetical protein